ncbi:hypothetical protein Taro_037416, partial [Colocasia esculenta]|nr:hypothetical protein [Colocasia esculenta]
ARAKLRSSPRFRATGAEEARSSPLRVVGTLISGNGDCNLPALLPLFPFPVLPIEEEAQEELEPLFDYSRVQPACFIVLDDDDGADSPAPKRKKCSDASGKDRKVEDEVVSLDGDKGHGDEEEDWLPPPPPDVFADSSAELAKDKTIQELRLKKQELASFTRSAEDVMRTVIESAKREIGSRVKSDDLEAEVKEAVKPKVDRPKILISIQDKDGHKEFRVFKDDKFERIFKMYANRINCNLESLVFCFDGDKVSPSATPGSLGMEDDDIIEVHFKSH